jgi:hypothetical protein
MRDEAGRRPLWTYRPQRGLLACASASAEFRTALARSPASTGADRPPGTGLRNAVGAARPTRMRERATRTAPIASDSGRTVSCGSSSDRRPFRVLRCTTSASGFDEEPGGSSEHIAATPVVSSRRLVLVRSGHDLSPVVARNRDCYRTDPATRPRVPLFGGPSRTRRRPAFRAKGGCRQPQRNARRGGEGGLRGSGWSRTRPRRQGGQPAADRPGGSSGSRRLRERAQVPSGCSEAQGLWQSPRTKILPLAFSRR